MKNEIQFEIGFADGEILHYHRENDLIQVNIKAWNSKIIHVIFREVVGVRDIGIGDISNFVEDLDKTTDLVKALSQVYEVIPDQQPYRIFQFLNLDDEASLEIIAQSVEISLK